MSIYTIRIKCMSPPLMTETKSAGEFWSKSILLILKYYKTFVYISIIILRFKNLLIFESLITSLHCIVVNFAGLGSVADSTLKSSRGKLFSSCWRTRQNAKQLFISLIHNIHVLFSQPDSTSEQHAI